ncbi:amino acid adenylation domain-containing protein [Streptomyces sp. NPDC008001]|uniref:amino acid adenylation domain-containing protein n=1 Tax=Streptomyces sp. NPDC008001 TaxID=3364804 RepID=UPI0036EFD261
MRGKPAAHPPEVARWNSTARAYSADLSPVDLLDAAAERHALRPAVRTTAGVAFTHAGLARASRYVAAQLAGIGVRDRQAVAVLVDHVPEAVAVIHGIVRHNAFYVPLDPRWPVARAVSAVASIGVTHLIVTPGYRELAHRLWSEHDGGLTIHEVAADGTLSLVAEGRTQPQHAARPELGHLAYTIFTSGSSGTPKAVAVTRDSLVNLVRWFNRRNEVGPEDVLLQLAAWSFDLSVYDLFGVPAAGASILLLPQSVMDDPEEVADVVTGHDVTLWNTAPAAFTTVALFLELGGGPASTTMRRVFLSGDWIPLTTPALTERIFPKALLVALGGATEACVWSNDFPVREADPEWPSIPYGHPMDNARYYVLSDDLTPCAVGEPGELYIAGACVAAGYINDPQLTAERFMPDPWSATGERMYRTGDQAKWTAAGWVEFLGRLDSQVKVRGFRIELGEVEQCAGRVPGIAEAVAVTAGEPRDPVLCLAVRATQPIGPDEVRAHLAEKLPGYMIPARIAVLGALPVGNTGKTDRRAVGDMFTSSIGQ